MNKPYANFQKYRMNYSFKKKIMNIEQNTRLYMYFPPISQEYSGEISIKNIKNLKSYEL